MTPPPCTRAGHAAIAADPRRFAAELVRHRPWTEARLVAAECPRCRSTLCREMPAADAEGAAP